MGAIQRLLGIEALHKEVEELRQELSEVKEHTQSLEDETDSIHALAKDNSARLRDLEQITVDLTDRQREALEVFLRTEDEEWLDVRQLSEKLDTSRNNAGSILSDLKKKIDFDIKTVDHGRKLYNLPESEQEKIFSS